MTVGLLQHRIAGQPVVIPPTGVGWTTFKLGAAGQITAIDIVPDATLGQVMVVRADTLGCYWYDKNAVNHGNAGGLGVWKQMVTKQSMPNITDVYRHAGGGCWEIKIAPSNTSRFYMVAGDGLIFRTENRGVSWVACGILPGGPYSVFANDQTSKFVTGKIAVDPNNADKVFVSTPYNGVFVSTNAGVSWTAVPQIAFGMNTPEYKIGTSTTSNNIATGTHTFTLTSGVWYWQPGSKLIAYQTSNPANQLSCVVTTSPAQSSATGTVNVLANGTRGSGTNITDWTLDWDNFQQKESLAPIINYVNSSLIYAGAYGVGVWRSTDGGTNWTFLNSANMPTKPGKLDIDSNGVLYVTNWLDYTLWKYVGSTWTNVSAAITGYAGFGACIHPTDPLKIFIGSSNVWYYTTNGGSTWSMKMESAGPRTATDIPHLANVEPFTIGNAEWGPDNVIYIADGIGVWKLLPADIPMNSGLRAPVTSQSIGIEQLVVNWIQSRVGQPLAIICMDRALFVISDQTKYPLICKSQAIVTAGPNHADIHEGYALEYASSSPSFMLALVGESFTAYGAFYLLKSTDNGATWTKHATNPTGITASSGCVAALTPTNWLWVEANGWNAPSSLGGRVWYTKDAGATWAQITAPGIAALSDGWYGPSAFYSLRRHIAVADRVNGNFYMYNSGSVLPGVWRSTDGGVNFARVCTTRLDGVSVAASHVDQWSCQIRPLPPYPGYTGGEMYITAGINDPGAFGAQLHELKDIGSSVTMTPIAGTSEVWTVGIGKAKTGNTYPTIFIYGGVDAAHDVAGIGGRGVWMSDDHCLHWTRLSPTLFVNDALDAPGVIEGDMDVYGKCYVGFFGYGIATYTP